MPYPLISVLMTAYNREKYIAEGIESVLAQTFADFEFIIVDDASEDRSHEIAVGYAARDPRIRVYRNERNLGDYPNRNRAAELARGKYLKYLDSDDLLYPHGLGVMVSSMEKFPNAGVGLCRLDCEYGPYPIALSSQEAYREHFLGGGLFAPGPSGSIISAAAFRAVGGFSEKRWVSDTELWLKLAARFHVVKMVLGLIWYRVHDGQEFTHELGMADPIAWRYKIASEAISSQGGLLLPVERREALCRLKHLHARRILSCAIRGNPSLAWLLYRRSDLSLGDITKGLRRPPRAGECPKGVCQ